MNTRAWTALLPAVVLTACTFTDLRTITTPPPPPSRTLILGPLSYEERTPLEREYKQSWPTYQGPFEKGMREYVRNHGRGEWAFSTYPRAARPRDVVVTGNITRVDQGYAALRFFFGAGAGQMKMAGDFEVRSADGMLLHKFHAQKSYLGGWGVGGPWVTPALIGGWDYLDMGDVALRFGETVAEETMDWTRDNLDRAPR